MFGTSMPNEGMSLRGETRSTVIAPVTTRSLKIFSPLAVTLSGNSP